MIKCIDMLFRYNKIYVDNKKKYIDDADSDMLYNANAREMFKKKGSFIITKTSHWENGKSEPIPMSDTDAKKAADAAYTVLDKYYPEFMNYCDIQVNDGLVYITVK